MLLSRRLISGLGGCFRFQAVAGAVAVGAVVAIGRRTRDMRQLKSEGNDRFLNPTTIVSRIKNITSRLKQIRGMKLPTLLHWPTQQLIN